MSNGERIFTGVVLRLMSFGFFGLFYWVAGTLGASEAVAVGCGVVGGLGFLIDVHHTDGKEPA